MAAGVTVMVDVIGALVLLIALNAGIFPVPPAPRPIAVLLLVQAKKVPVTGPLIEFNGTTEPLQ